MMEQTLSKPKTVEQLDAEAGCPALPCSPTIVPYAFPATQSYGAFRLPWRHDSYIHPAWGHEVHRVLSFDDCECFHGSGRDCIQIVNASRGTDADREVSPGWAKLSAYVKKKFHLANTEGLATRHEKQDGN